MTLVLWADYCFYHGVATLAIYTQCVFNPHQMSEVTSPF